MAENLRNARGRKACAALVTTVCALVLTLLATSAASAAPGASVDEGRGRFLVTVVEDYAGQAADQSILLDGREVTATCNYGYGDVVGSPQYHRICTAPAGPHRVEVHDAGAGVLYDGWITVQPANGLLDILDTLVSCLGLLLPVDPTYQDSFCRRIG